MLKDKWTDERNTNSQTNETKKHLFFHTSFPINNDKYLILDSWIARAGSCRNDKYHDNSYLNVCPLWVFAKLRCLWLDLVCALHDVCKIEILVTRLAKSRCWSSVYDDADPSMSIGKRVSIRHQLIFIRPWCWHNFSVSSTDIAEPT
jgi:hypothetical protein